MKNIRTIAALAMLAVSATATAEIKQIVAVPTTWRIDSTADGGIQAYYTGSTCSSGKIKILSSADTALKSRFWALVLAAKAAQTKVQVAYDDTQDCLITNFTIPRDSEPLSP